MNNLKQKLMLGAVMTALYSSMPMGGMRELEARRGHGQILQETARQKEKKSTKRFVSAKQLRKRAARFRSYERCLAGNGL